MSDAGTEESARSREGRSRRRPRQERRASQCRHAVVAVGETRAEAGYMPRFKKRYNDIIRAELMKKFGYTNAMQVPSINKVVLNIGAGEAASDSKKIQQAVNDLTAIAGQKAVMTRAKKAIATFKIREGLPIGAKVTLRGDRDVRIPRPPDHHGAAARARLPRRQSARASTAAATMPWA